MGEPPTASTAMVVADYLVRSGTRFAFAYPGDPTIELMERFRAQDVDVVLARREGTAAFMAEAYAMATGETGVCVSTLGPGSTALVNGVACATLDRVPMMAISGQIESSREQFFTHQVVDHGRLYAPVTKWAGRLEPGSVGTVMRKALRTATAERPGAVHLTATADAITSEARDAVVRMPPREPAAMPSEPQQPPTPREPPQPQEIDALERPAAAALPGPGSARPRELPALDCPPAAALPEADSDHRRELPPSSP